MSEVVLGLDVGTTAVKAVAFALDPKGVQSPWRRSSVREYPLLRPAPGWRTQDPEVVLGAIWDALRDCLAQVGEARVAAISVSAAMHGLVGLDAGGRRAPAALRHHRGRHHRERLVGREEAVAAGKEVALEPALAEVLGEDLEDPATRGDVVVYRKGLAYEAAVLYLEDGAEPVGVGLVRAEEPKIRLPGVPGKGVP